MKRTNLIAGIILSLLLIGGLAVNVGAQQPAAPPAPAETPQTPDSAARPAPPQVPPSSNNTQIETRTERTERVVERPATFLGVNATVAMVLGAVLVVVIVIGMVAMSRRNDEVHHTHSRI